MQDFALQEYLHQIWKRRKVVGIFFFSVLIFAWLYTYNQERVYRAETTVEIGAETPDVFFQDVVNTTYYGWWAAIKYYETQYQLLQSRSLLEKVAQKALEKGTISGRSLNTWTSYLQQRVSVGTDEKSRLARIYFEDVDPVRAQNLSIAVAEVFVEENIAKKLRGVDDAVAWLNERLKEIREEKRAQEEQLQKYKKEFKIVSLSDRETTARANLRSLAESLNRVKGKRIEVEEQWKSLRKLVNRSKKTEDLLGVVTNELLTGLKAKLADLYSEQSRLRHRYMEKHPATIRLKAEISEIEKLIRQEVENEVSRLKTKYVLAKAEEVRFRQELDQQKLETLRMDEISQRLSDVQVLTQTNQAVYETLQRKIKEADLSALVRSNNVRIVDRALVPGRPIRPNVTVNIVMALVIGLFGGVGLALALEYMDDTFRTHEDVERYLKLPVLGMVPHFVGADNGAERELAFLPADDPKAPISEFYRTLRTNILFLSATKGLNKMLIVSTGPSEGKTVTAINLGVTLAQTGQRTVILDLDFRRPKLHTAFDIKSRTGITNVLVGEAKLDEVIHHSKVPNLDYVLAGSLPPNPAELLGSKELKEFLEEVSQRYDRVIIDSSPIAPVTDAAIVAQIVDGVILIVRANRTHRKAVRFAHEQLKNVQAETLGVVLNDIELEKSTYGNYQYYKYGYAAYVDEEKKKKKRDPGRPSVSA